MKSWFWRVFDLSADAFAYGAGAALGLYAMCWATGVDMTITVTFGANR